MNNEDVFNLPNENAFDLPDDTLEDKIKKIKTLSCEIRDDYSDPRAFCDYINYISYSILQQIKKSIIKLIFELLEQAQNDNLIKSLIISKEGNRYSILFNLSEVKNDK